MTFPGWFRGAVLTALVALFAHLLVACGGGDGAERKAQEAEVHLGKLLFYDHRLSRTGAISCATCHDPAFAYSDRRRHAVGCGDITGPNTPTLANVGRRSRLLFSGLAVSLEDQARDSILFEGEMGGVDGAVVARRMQSIRGYGPLFLAAYGDTIVTLDRLAGAIAAFERTIVSDDSDYDRFVAGTGSLSKPARAGMAVFLGKGGCSQCHTGPDLTDDRFHATGTTELLPGGAMGYHTVTQKDWDIGKIRTPTLREVARTAPYFHNGAVETLEEVIRFYEKGGHPHPNLSPWIVPFELTDGEREGLVAFLESLSGRRWVEPRPVALPE